MNDNLTALVDGSRFFYILKKKKKKNPANKYNRNDKFGKSSLCKTQ